MTPLQGVDPHTRQQAVPRWLAGVGRRGGTRRRRGASVLRGECLSRLLPRFKRLPVAPDDSRWLLLIQTHAVRGSRWLLMASNDFHRVSLLPYHYPKALKNARSYLQQGLSIVVDGKGFAEGSLDERSAVEPRLEVSEG